MSSQPSQRQTQSEPEEQEHPLRHRLDEYLDVAPLSGSVFGGLLSGDRQPGDAFKLPERLHALLSEIVSTIVRIERTLESIQNTVEANARGQQELTEEVTAIQDEIKELHNEAATIDEIEALLDEKEFVTSRDDQADSE